MTRGSLSVFSCLWGNRKQAVKEHPQNVSPDSSNALREQLAPAPDNNKNSEGRRHSHRDAGYDTYSLLQFQRLLSDLRGTWLLKTHAALSSIAVFLDVADASFYSSSGEGRAGAPTGFVLLARESSDGCKACKDGQHVLTPGFEVWPAEERGKADAQERDIRAPVAATLETYRREICQRMMPNMLTQMLATQAPVIQAVPNPAAPNAHGRSEGDTTQNCTCDVAVLVPLTVGNRIAGALWLVRYGSASGDLPITVSQSSSRNIASGSVMKGAFGGGNSNINNSSSIAEAAPTTAAAALPTSGGLPIRPPSSRSLWPELQIAASQVPPPCPSLLFSPSALQQLALSVSMCLLATETQYLAALCDGLHQLSVAGSMQQLVGGLCDAVAGHVRERFLLEPRVFAALVPDLDSPVGLMVNRSSAVTPTLSRSVSKLQRGATVVGSGAGEGPLSASVGDCRRIFGGSATLQSPRVMTAVPAAVLRQHSSIGGRPKSDLASRSGVPIIPPGSQDRDGAAGAGDLGPPPARGARPPALHRVVALSQGDVAPLDAGSVGGAGAGGSNSFAALRAKPFPLSQTLLRHVIRRISPSYDASSTAAAQASAQSGYDSAQAIWSGSPCLGRRAHAIEVEDCAMHMQDPKKPSRDILLLIANCGAGGSAVATAFGGSFGGSALGGSLGSSFTSGRRPVSSLLLLVLPVADGNGKTMMALYVTFPQSLPQQLLRQARCNLMEILEVLSPVVSRKLSTDLYVELETLITAPPGSYAVMETTEKDEASGGGDGDAGICTGPMTINALDACDATLRPCADGKLILPQETEAGTHVLTMCSPLVQSFLYDSRGLGQTSGTGGGGPAGGSVPGVTRSLNLMDTVASPNVAGDNTMVTASLLLVRGSAIAASNLPAMATGCGDGLTRSTLIHMEELDTVQSTLRAQMPLLVASMQSSISNARMDAVVAAAAASMNKSRVSFGVSTQHSFAGADNSDLAQLELHSQLGHGGCAVVFKGTLGTLDCAVKLMEMPDVDGVDATELPTSKTDVTLNLNGRKDDSGNGGEERTRVEARRALLRNAMELAAMTSISHPNIMQVYSTFSNVTLGRRTMPDGTDHFYLKPVEEPVSMQPDMPPVCVGIVCEWCDKGCLATAMKTRVFPVVLTSAKKGAVTGSGRLPRALDYKGILMTLLDVAMALRYLHSHHLIHRDVKPANVLLKSNVMDPRGFTAKLADFGFVTLLNQPGDEKSGGEPFTYMDDTCGTVTHMAPECWLKPVRLDASCDVYSFGILMWEMTAGGLRPYPDLQPSNIAPAVKRGLRPVFDDFVPVQYRLLAQRCWTAEPASRPRTPELVTAISQLLSRL